MTSTPPVSYPPGEEQDFNRALNVLKNEAQNIHVKEKIGDYSTLLDVDPKSSELRVGNLQFGEDVINLKRFGKWLLGVLMIYC
jgi:hypothetical protein